jgi:hypothetical protein
MEVNKLKDQADYKQFLKLKGKGDENLDKQVNKKSLKDAKVEGNKENLNG